MAWPTGTKVDIHNEEEANRILQAVEGADFVVDSVKKGQRRRSPAPPFTTSTLQQEASRKLGFQARRTMKVAQELYEGVELKDMGAVGLITLHAYRLFAYFRRRHCRSAHLYWRPSLAASISRKKNAITKRKPMPQDGHEAIRPTSVGPASG